MKPARVSCPYCRLFPCSGCQWFFDRSESRGGMVNKEGQSSRFAGLLFRMHTVLIKGRLFRYWLCCNCRSEKSLKPEKAGCITLCWRFRVPCRVEKSQFLTLIHIGVGITDPVDHLVSLKTILKLHLPQVALEFIPVDIYDHIFQIIQWNMICPSIQPFPSRPWGFFTWIDISGSPSSSKRLSVEYP